MPFKRNNAFSGGEKKFGGSGFKPRSFGGGRDAGYGASRDFSRPQMHETTCAACNKRCEVPFKPNGRKPTFCGDCFRKEGGGRDQEESRSYSKPRYEQRSYEPAAQKSPVADPRIDEMNMKLDRILRELETMKGQAE